MFSLYAMQTAYIALNTKKTLNSCYDLLAVLTLFTRAFNVPKRM